MSDPYTFNHDDASCVLVRCASHRARQSLDRLLANHGETGQPYYSWDTACTGGIVAVPFRLFPEAVRLTGCSRASRRFAYHPCW